MLLDGYYDPEHGICYSCQKDISDDEKNVIFTIGMYRQNTIVVLGQIQIPLDELEKIDICTRDVVESFVEKLHEKFNDDTLDKKITEAVDSNNEELPENTEFIDDIIVSKKMQ